MTRKATPTNNKALATSEILDRVPPQDVDAERSLISSFILQPANLDQVNGLGVGDFYDPANRAVFAAMKSLREQDKPVDTTLLVSAIKEAGQFDTVGGMAGIFELAKAAPVVANWKYYLDRIHQTAHARRLIIALGDALRDAYEGKRAEVVKQRVIALLENVANADPLQSPILVRLADVEPREIEWLWPGRIAKGKLSLFAGDPGLGKSFLSLDIAARVSTGARWPDCSSFAPQGSVVLMTVEDDLADTVRPRLDAAAADVSKIVALDGVRSRDADGKYERTIDLQRDLPLIEQSIASLPDCRLAILDPISAFMGQADTHVNAEVRAVLAPLAELAAKRSIAVIAITHLRKSEGPAVYRAIGSLGFTAAARAVWAIAKDKADSKRRLFLPIKNNLAADNNGLAFTLSHCYSGARQPCVVWEADPVTIRADEALSQSRGKQPTAIDAAKDFLQDALTGGPRSVKEIEEEAREAHGIKERTLNRARNDLGVEAFREIVPGPWLLRLRRQVCQEIPV